MYYNRKIGVFISHIMGYYQKNVCQGIIDKALEYGYSVEVFASLDGENLGDYERGEENILSIPNYDELSGIIFASDTYRHPDFRQKLYQLLNENRHCPVIEIAADSQFPSIRLDNNSTILQLTRHLIQTHACKRICYLGCRKESYFSDIREHYYRQAMEEAGLSVAKSDIFQSFYTRESVSDALSAFTANDTKPDAVICYNDRMALLFMQAAMEGGYHIPEDFAITGCDYTEQGQNAFPALTTVSFPTYDLGSAAVENLLALIRKESVPRQTIIPSQVILGDSCGCHNAPSHSSLFYEQRLLNRIDSLESSILSSMRMSAALQGVVDIDDGMDLLEEYVQEIEHCREFYLFLYSGWDSVSRKISELTATTKEDASNEILLKLAIRDGKRLPEYSFPRNASFSERIYRHSASAYLYMPLYFEERNFGYIALSFENNRMDYPFRLVHWFMNINQMLERICENKKASILFRHLEDVYTRDSLTGLYNRQGYLQQEELLLQRAIEEESTITAFFFDLDGLKYINDTFGHHEGDFAIEVIGHTLASMIRPYDICARFSGDEFYLLTIGYTKEDADELIARIQKYLSNYNKLSNKNYTIGVSGGYAQTVAGQSYSKENLKDLFSRADASMYRQKEAHHAILSSYSCDTP